MTSFTMNNIFKVTKMFSRESPSKFILSNLSLNPIALIVCNTQDYLCCFDSSSTIARISVDGAQYKLYSLANFTVMLFERLVGDFQPTCKGKDKTKVCS